MNQEKFENVVLAICENFPPFKLATVKLNKLIWLIDKTAMCNTGESITGVNYIRKMYGPVPEDNHSAFRRMEKQGLLAIKMEESKDYNHRKVVYSALKSYEPSIFSEEENNIITDVLHQYSNYEPNDLIKMSHDLAWATYEDGEIIPLGAYLSSSAGEDKNPDILESIFHEEQKYEQ